MLSLFFFSIFSIVITWAGYPLILYFLNRIPNQVSGDKQNTFVTANSRRVSIIIAAYNEENNIKKRINNLLELDIPSSIEMDIHVGSDGSDDATEEIVKKYQDERVNLHVFDRIGRAAMHNRILSSITSEIVIFTDAETEFEGNFLQEILLPLEKSDVGVVVGNLNYKDTGSDSNKAESLYWHYEKFVRKLEERNNILCNGTGAAMAIRTEIFKNIDPSEDVDTAIPIDAHIQGYKVIYAWSAIAYDYTIETHDQAFNSKIRGASQTILCWKNRLNLKFIFRHKLLFFSFIFHRLLRYSTFLFLSLAVASLVIMLGSNETLYFSIVCLSSLLLFLTFGFVMRNNKKENLFLRISKFLYLFTVSASGMFIGMLKGFLDKSTTTY